MTIDGDDVWQCPAELATFGRHLWNYACDSWPWLVASDLIGLKTLCEQIDDIEHILKVIRCDLGLKQQATHELLRHTCGCIDDAREWASHFGMSDYDIQRLGLFYLRPGLTPRQILDIEQAGFNARETSRRQLMPKW